MLKLARPLVAFLIATSGGLALAHARMGFDSYGTGRLSMPSARSLANRYLPSFITTVTESKAGATAVKPAFPNDRIVSGPYLTIAAVNDNTADHSNTILGTANYPQGTRTSSTYPLDGKTNVRSFVFTDYGNYLDSIPTITPVHIKDIATLTQAYSFTATSQAGNYNGTFDWFLFSDSSGTTAKIVNELQVYWYTAATTKTSFLDTLPVVGYYTSAAIGAAPSLTWKVTREASNTQGVPYYQFRLVDGSDNSLTMYAGSFDLAAAMNWLRTQNVPGSSSVKCLTGAEYFTGFGNGYEILSGSVTLDVNAISTTYTPGAAAGGTAANLYIYPGDLTDAAWKKTGLTTPAVDTVLETNTGTNTAHAFGQDFSKARTAVTRHFEAVVTNAATSGLGRDWVHINVFNDDYSGAVSVNYNTATAALGTTYGYGGVTLSGPPTITSQGSGKFLLSWDVNLDASPSFHVLIGPSTGDDVSSYQGDTTKGLKVTGLLVR